MIMSNWDKVDFILRNIKEVIEEKGLDYYLIAPISESTGPEDLEVFEFSRLLAVGVTQYIGEYWNE